MSVQTRGRSEGALPGDRGDERQVALTVPGLVRVVALAGVLKRFSPFSHGLDEQTAWPVNAPIAL